MKDLKNDPFLGYPDGQIQNFDIYKDPEVGMKERFWSFQAKLSVMLILLTLFVLLINNLLVYRFTFDSQFSQLRKRLIEIAQTAALMIDADLLLQIPLNKEGTNTLPYKIIVDKLKEIKTANPHIYSIYTLTRTEEPTVLQFIADSDPSTPEGRRKGLPSYPGDRYDASQIPEMLKAFTGPLADKELVKDPWGVFLSGYAPIRDKTGKAVAILGIDLMADHVYKIQKVLISRLIMVLPFGIILSCSLSILVSRKVANVIKRLIEGARFISEGDLKYRIKIKGSDEIAELAESINKMAESFDKSRQELHDYFYRAVKSLILSLEAKDPYTRGHTERVADYSRKIALALDFSQEEAELLREVAVLHDIGKIGIPEEILNKRERLTEDEWKIIQRHPVTGEEILRPICYHSYEREMLKIVRHHHERWDGKGYPDKLIAENISILAQIVSVADTYDAMTSDRPYRPALSKELAIAELLKNRGTQLSPVVVDAFIKILQNECQVDSF